MNYAPYIVLSREALKIAVIDCLQLSSVGDCSAGKYGPIGEWDVSRVTDMTKMFYQARSFNMDISNWNVSRVTNMASMFYHAISFNMGGIVPPSIDVDVLYYYNHESSDTGISNWNVSRVSWDVSRVTDMASMFNEARSFNMDISNWDVSRVTNMHRMFYNAKSFDQILCGEAWVHSKALQRDMFTRSPGSVSKIICGLCSVKIIFI